MRTEEMIKGALENHSKNMLADEKTRERIAKELGWSLEHLKGFAEGVKWAYEWVLGLRDK